MLSGPGRPWGICFHQLLFCVVGEEWVVWESSLPSSFWSTDPSIRPAEEDNRNVVKIAEMRSNLVLRRQMMLLRDDCCCCIVL